MRGLYAIVDVAVLSRRRLPLYAFTEAVVSARPAALQLRDKRGDARHTLAALRNIAPLAARAGVALYANDRPDLALLAGCDGVHIGQDDVPISVVRASIASQLASLSVGISTHDEAQMRAAAVEDPTYIAIGPIFETSHKDNPSPVIGLERLGKLSQRLRRSHPGLPIVAIGGITLETAFDIGRLCSCAAVIGALLPDGEGPGAPYEVADRAASLHRSVLEGHADAEAQRTRAVAQSSLTAMAERLQHSDRKDCA
jgi:thiamine-phosphate pyrophosphorylase